MMTEDDRFAARRALLAETAHAQSPEIMDAAEAVWREHVADDLRSYGDLPENEKALWRYIAVRVAMRSDRPLA